MKKTAFIGCAASGLMLLSAPGWAPVHSRPSVAAAAKPPSIDGTYELTERVMASGAVIRPPSIVALYTNADGHFNLNLFVRKTDGALASESTVGRYKFSGDKYCEWIIYTIRKDLDKPGVTNEAPAVSDHCTPVLSKDGRLNFSPPGEGVEVSYGSEGLHRKNRR